MSERKPNIMERYGLRIDTTWSPVTLRRRVLLRVYGIGTPAAAVELTPREAGDVARKLRRLACWVQKNPTKRPPRTKGKGE